MPRKKTAPVRPYGPNRGSLRGRLIAFFEANPDEELRVADIIAKFDANPRSVYSRLGEMKKAGELRCEFIVRGGRK